MAATNGYDPSDIVSEIVVQYVTSAYEVPAFATAYGEANQTLTEMSPAGVKVQPNTLSLWI